MYVFMVIISVIGVVGSFVFWFAAKAPRESATIKDSDAILEACWFYQEGSEKKGPVLLEEITIRIERGDLVPNTLVWTSKFEEWTPANVVLDISEYSDSLKEHTKLKESSICTEDEFKNALSLFAEDLGYTSKEVHQRMILEDHTGRSCITVLARRLDVDPAYIKTLL